MDQPARLAVDIGGTFTDVVLEVGGRLISSKVLTTPQAPDDAVITGTRDVLDEAGVGAGSVAVAIHGTTLATNAILERTGAVTALLTTAGFRDVLEIGYESRYDQYDVFIDKPVPLVPRTRRLPVRERVDVAGAIVEPLVEQDVLDALPTLDALGVQSVAVGYLHAYANPVHEERTGELLAEHRPDLSVTLASEVCPEVREYERFSTATANAYVRPLMERYLGRLGRRLRELGLGCPLLLMTSGGGLTSIETAMRFPIRLVESGPAGGAILASGVAEEMGFGRVISFDMGGTTAKICLIQDHQPRSAREFEVDRAARFLKGSGLPLRVPVIEMVEIGAGGGSIARVDQLGQIAVGPQSAGADPGPAGYARGGEAPTITDADIVLGRIDPARFAGGKVTLAPELSAAAIERAVATPLGLSGLLGAYGITEMVDEAMANAARVHAVEQGADASQYTLIAFGGAAPLHVGRLAEKLGVQRIVVPASAGVGSAIGFLRAPVAYEVVRSRNMRLGAFDHRLANDIVAEMGAEARAVVEAGAPGEPLDETRGAYMRYVGQGHEILVPIPVRALEAGDERTLHEAYEQAYEALYNRVIPGAEVEVLTWALTVSSRRARREPVSIPDGDAGAPRAGARHVFDPVSGEREEIALYWRPDLSPGMALAGPAIIAEDETSTFVTAGFEARIASNLSIVAERVASSG